MKKAILSLVMMLFMAFSICLTGCSETVLTVNPKTEETVISNGGMSVIKGDYLYFVNGYTDISDNNTSFTNKSNKWGEVGKSAIYRTKLKNGVIEKDEDGFLIDANTDLVVPRVVGFNNGGFHIIDDYIYYATPNNRDVDSNGNSQKKKIEFHRININGSKKSDTRLYITANATEDLVDWTIRKVGDKVYLLVKDGTNIISYNATDNTLVKKIENATSYAFYTEDNYVYEDDRSSVGENYVYYTRDIIADDNVSTGFDGNVICRFNIATGQVDDSLELLDKSTFKILHSTEDTIYYTIKNSGKERLFKKVVSSCDAEWGALTSVQLANSEYTNYYFADYGNDLVLATDGTNTYRLEGTNLVAPVVVTTSRDILGIYGNYAYYYVDNTLVRFDINTTSADDSILETVSEEGSSYTIDNRNCLDFDGQNLYVYCEYVSANNKANFYLDYINNTTLEERFVGVFENGHTPAEPEQPEEEVDENGDPVERIPHID